MSESDNSMSDSPSPDALESMWAPRGASSAFMLTARAVGGEGGNGGGGAMGGGGGEVSGCDPFPVS